MNKKSRVLIHLCMIILIFTVAGCTDRNILLVDEFFREYYISSCPLIKRVSHRLDSSLTILYYSDLSLTDNQTTLLNDLANYSETHYLIYTPLFLPFVDDMVQQISFAEQYVISFDKTNIDQSINTPTLSYSDSTSQIAQHIQTIQSNEETPKLIAITQPLNNADEWIRQVIELIDGEEIEYEHSTYITIQDSDIRSIVATLDSNRFNLALILLAEHSANIIKQTSTDDISIITEHLTPAFDERIVGYIAVDYCDLNTAIDNIADSGLILNQKYVNLP